MANRKPLVLLDTGLRGEVPASDVIDPVALGIDVSRFLQATNSVLASTVPNVSTTYQPVDALMEAVVAPNAGATSCIIFTQTLIAYPGGAFETLVTSWLTKSATPDSNGLVGLGQSASAAAATIAQIRAAALQLTP